MYQSKHVVSRIQINHHLEKQIMDSMGKKKFLVEEDGKQEE